MAFPRYILLAALFAAPAYAQASGRPPTYCEQQALDARKIKLGGYTYPFAGALQDSTASNGGNRCSIISFYRTFDPTPSQTAAERRSGAARIVDLTPRFIARLTAAERDTKGEWTTSVSWAAQESCPALVPALDGVPALVSFNFTGNRNGEGAGFTLDGVWHQLWIDEPVYPVGQEDYRASVTMKSNLGTPLADWVGATVKALQPCWTSTAPAVK